MNYLRGAVSAISAPYQYYKDINPATLTGAIDVIVISRPRTDDGDHANDGAKPPANDDGSELACSPFHVRFGKWQVLRPADKKVNVFVNGNLIPFSMKIGDAGEAFFIFETDEDVPEEIVTSPLLEATKPGEANEKPQRTGRFGAKEDSAESPTPTLVDTSQEPDFLDLNASGKEELGTPPQSALSAPSAPDASTAPSYAKHETETPSLLERTAELGKAAVQAVHEVEKAGKDELKDHNVKAALKDAEQSERAKIVNGLNAAKSTTTSSLLGLPAGTGDDVLDSLESERAKTPEVTYGHDMVFDTEGYHSRSHAQERSDETVTSGERNPISEPTSADATPGPSRSTSPEPSSVPFPRATSEPPPDVPGLEPSSPPRYPVNGFATMRGPPGGHASNLKLTLPEADEYLWEWGNFPQKTPVWTAFSNARPRGIDRKGKGRMPPDELNADFWDSSTIASNEKASYGSGGLLTVERDDPTRFRVFIEGRTVEFELSLVPDYDKLDRAQAEAHPGTLGGKDAVEDSLLFEAGRIDFARFLQDEKTVNARNLVIRWAGDIYITRDDHSPLMDALVLWRDAALSKLQATSRPVSPDLDDDRRQRTKSTDTDDALSSGDERRKPLRSATADSTETQKKSSSSWARWWSRKRDIDVASRPELRPANSEPPRDIEDYEPGPPPPKPRPLTRSDATESAPALLSTPVLPLSRPVSPPLPPADQQLKPKRYAKTLRLTSEQLKSLNLRKGANTITFSLSATGVAACTARIFVWDYNDQIVVSDIDGTITKSDALGHVFTMIGRDWTHLGVAKLYTDICRNGYKVMYLTSRAIGQADSTRDYLKGIKQNDYQLPEGPVIMSPDRLMASLHREVIMRKPEVFKMACLRDIQRLFGPSAHLPFYAGFGNRITDALSYRSVNVPSSRIFTIDSTGEVKMELLELAGYKSSYIHMTDLVDQMFPPINRKWAPEFTDFNYWKTPLPEVTLPDLTPPSPALSARSDTSNQSTLARLRNFSLVGRQGSSAGRPALPLPVTDPAAASTSARRADGKDGHLRQMSSLERLSSTLASLTHSTASAISSPRSMTPTSEDSESEDEEGEVDDGDVERGRQGGRKRQRRRSVSSMPGSLPGSESSDEEMHFGDEDGEEHEGEEGYGYGGEGEEEEVAEEAFDEDLLATGEMESVPFL